MTFGSICDRCGCDMLGYRGYIEFYDPKAIRRYTLMLCPDCQTKVAMAIKEVVGRDI